jgi:hypothetical protein
MSSLNQQPIEGNNFLCSFYKRWEKQVNKPLIGGSNGSSEKGSTTLRMQVGYGTYPYFHFLII